MNQGAFTIYHNPACGTSRNTLALMRACGVEPTIVEYLQTPPDRQTLKALVARMGSTTGVRELLRVKGTPYKELGLDAPELGDEELLSHMLAHPILINRPIVVSPLGVKLCRPSDVVLDLLPRPLVKTFLKEDGSPILVDKSVDAHDPGLRATLSEAGLPVDDLAHAGRWLYAFTTLDGERVGYGGFERYGPDVLLRSIVVLPAARTRGIGSGILALLMRRAFDHGARRAWLLTTSAARFFEQSGFKPVERTQAPQAIRDTQQAQALCPASAVLLGRSINL
jgi:arsenate reductase (glutaredoxin)